MTYDIVIVNYYNNTRSISLVTCIAKLHTVRCNYNQFQCSQLEPPIVFGYSHSHTTRSSALFIRPVHYHLSNTQRFFHSKTMQWWNSLTEDMLMAQDFSSTLFSYLLDNWLHVIYKLIIVCFCVCKFFVPVSYCIVFVFNDKCFSSVCNCVLCCKCMYMLREEQR